MENLIFALPPFALCSLPVYHAAPTSDAKVGAAAKRSPNIITTCLDWALVPLAASADKSAV